MKERFQTFTALISKISRNVKKIKNQEMADYGLRSVHVSCLYYLQSSEGLTATELCELCEEDKATISRAVEFLEEKRYVTCEDQTSRRYKSRLLLTESGGEVAEKITEKINVVLDEVCIDLTEAQRAEFYRSLEIISESLELCTKGIGEAKTIKRGKDCAKGE